MARVLLILTLLIPTAAVFGSWAQGIRHTLANNPDWTSVKPTLERSVIGSVAYTRTPIALANERLNTGPWHGFQQVMLARPVAPGTIRFSAEIPSGSHLDVLYGDAQGIRLSHSEAYRSVHFRTDGHRFTETSPLALPDWPDGPVSIALRFDPSGVALHIGEREAARLPHAAPGPWPFGFRGGIHALYIDDVVISGADGAVVFSEDFSPRTHWLESTAWAFALLGLFAGLLALLLARRRRARVVIYASAIVLALLPVGVTGWLADRLVLQGFHGYSTFLFKFQRPFVIGEAKLEEVDAIWERLRREAEDLSQPDAHRIMVIGSSQTWGAGASRSEDHMVSYMEGHLAELGLDRPTVCWSAGVNGRRAEELFDAYRDEWIRWRPKIVLINLGNNDTDAVHFAAQLERIVAMNREQGIRTAFVLEANAPGSPRATLAANHAAMRELAAKHSVPFFDLHGHIHAHHESGFVWWDFVHMTDHGQRMAGRFLAEQLVKLL